ncbi:MAG: tyrosine-type recombinase/integrase [Prevotella sp.]
MTRNQKATKAKEPIRLRMKNLKNGNKSLYLDTYRNGKRSYEFLKLYLVPETDKNARRQNQATLTAAYKIKADRIIELTNREAGISQTHKGQKIYLLDWMRQYKDNQQKRGRKDGYQIDMAIRILATYAGEKVTMDKVDKAFCKGYIDCLLTAYKPNGKPVRHTTAHNYYRVVNGALNAAVREDIIKLNPFTKLCSSDKIHKPESKREYITVDEVRKLIATPMRNPQIKAAYLFSCFCGLRISDINALTWENVYEDSGQTRLQVVMQKTKVPIYLPLSPEALRWMPKREGKDAKEKVFRLPSTVTVNLLLKPWAKAAGINKHVTFHTARHTFATMMLTLGADLYTTSKLLGHTDVRMTQIYAKIINRKKDEAVNLVNGLFD